MATPEMGLFLEHARKEFDIVIVDGAPVLGFAETKALCRQIGNVVLVVKAGRTTLDTARKAQEDLLGVGAHVLGCVVNFVPEKRSRHLSHTTYPRSPKRRWPLRSREALAELSSTLFSGKSHM
jgi:Mrp family chromosome partitioning ATPase